MASLALLLVAGQKALASAWNVPAGQGLAILQGLFDTGSQSWDPRGHVVATAPYHKWEGSLYMEYGLTDWLQVIAAPDFVSTRVGGAPGGRFTGFGTSAAGAQVQLPSWGAAAFALQGTFHLPASHADRNPALTGNTTNDTDLRGLVGLPLTLGPWPAFIDAEAGYRFRSGQSPSEIRVDLTAGFRPRADWLVLLQSFSAIPTAAGSAYFPRSSYAKLQGSAVYDIDPHWSVQFGVFGTVWGRNALQERGAQTALWYRF